MKVAYEVTIKKSGNTFAEVFEDKEAAIGYGEYKAKNYGYKYEVKEVVV